MRKSKPRALIFSGYGLNCEEETKAAFEMAGAAADIIHINDLIAKPALFKQYQIAAFPGGFSYGDDTGSGKAYANRVKRHFGDALDTFLARDTLMIGICNGFQILTSAGILPGALVANDCARYLTRWVDLKVTSNSPWLTGISTLSLPIAHGEGKYFATKDMLAKLKRTGDVALTYVKGETAKHFNLPANPNGAMENIAGITGYKGRVLGMMPHPERAVRFTQLPHWTYLAQGMKKLPAEGPGIALFKNAVRYFA
ncbi:MAG: phosphoribosylformylglycinamidine synthase subunit PurQ [Patescibacteria group bacterium]